MSFLATIGNALMPTALETIGNLGRSAIGALGTKVQKYLGTPERKHNLSEE